MFNYSTTEKRDHRTSSVDTEKKRKGEVEGAGEEGSLEGDVCIVVLEETEDGFSSCLSQILIPKSKLGLKISTLWLSSLCYIF